MKAGQIALATLTLVLSLSGCLPAVSPTTRDSPPTSGAATAVPPTSPPYTEPIRTKLAWFYKPPLDANELLSIAANYDFFILTRGDEAERDQLLALGAGGPILQYLRFDAIHDPGDCAARPRRNQAAFLEGDFCRINHEHPDWFLLSRVGERISQVDEDQTYFMMDPGNPGWREFFLERVRESQSDPDWGGVFLDNVEVTFSFRKSSGQYPAAYPDEAGYLAAAQGMLEYLQSEYFRPNRKLLFANIVARENDAIWMSYLTHLDGAMHEGWAVDWPNRFRPADAWEKQMTLAEETQASGRFILLISQGTQADVELQRFAYASYLLVNQGRAVFRYGNSEHYREAWFYNNYYFDLGQPLGWRTRDGEAWRREFENGNVMVNPATHESEITVRP